MIKHKILDIGCGNKSIGDVNVDLYINKGEHRLKEDYFIEMSKTPNFIKCDAHCLPFRDKAFDISYSHHVLEHLENPLKALIEWERVGKKLVVVVPDLKVCRIYGEFEPHLFSWSKWSLQHLLEKVCSDVDVKVNRIPLQLQSKNKIGHIINFLLKRFFIHFPFLQNSELMGICFGGYDRSFK